MKTNKEDKTFLQKLGIEVKTGRRLTLADYEERITSIKEMLDAGKIKPELAPIAIRRLANYRWTLKNRLNGKAPIIAKPVKLNKSSHPQLEDVVGMLTVGLTPLLVGPAGCGKTYVAEQAAKSLGLTFGHLCFSAGVSETWLFGRQTPSGFVSADFVKLYKDGGLFLADEMDAADANLLLTINTALANGHLYNPISGQVVPRHKDFHFIGAANTVGKGGDIVYTGRSRLDGATLDRFTIVQVGYDSSVEELICPDRVLREKLIGLREALIERNSKEIISYRAFHKATKLKSINKTTKQILDILTASFPKSIIDELRSSGVL